MKASTVVTIVGLRSGRGGSVGATDRTPTAQEADRVTSTSLPRSDLGFVTPDAVALDLEVATIGSRGIAYLLDLALFAAVFVVLSLVQLALGGGGWFDSGLGVAIALVLAFLWQFGYPIGFETLWRGRTLGKAAMGLRVVTVEGAPVGVRHATIRAVTAPFEVLLTTGLVASIASFASPRAQRLGDLAAGTLVVRERRIAREPQAATFRPPPGSETYVAQVDVSAVGPREYGLVRDTLRRAGELPAEARWQVAGEVAEVIAPRVRPLPPAGTSPEAFLAAVAAAVQRRAATGTGRATPSSPTAPSVPPAPTASSVPPAPTASSVPPAPPAPPVPPVPPRRPDQGFQSPG
ncbi:MAG: RDD family protein [Nitriliruptor sp.]|nr:MAG: RDD family protein [Nitriliruptor sp.]